MKKYILFFAAAAAMTFSSCGNQNKENDDDDKEVSVSSDTAKDTGKAPTSHAKASEALPATEQPSLIGYWKSLGGKEEYLQVLDNGEMKNYRRKTSSIIDIDRFRYELNGNTLHLQREAENVEGADLTVTELTDEKFVIAEGGNKAAYERISEEEFRQATE